MIKVTKHFYIDSDESSFIVIEKKLIKKGKLEGEVRNEIFGYYSTLKGAIQGIYKTLTRRMVHKYDESLDEALKRLDEMYDRYLGSLKEV